jgi:hypothetical protein
VLQPLTLLYLSLHKEANNTTMALIFYELIFGHQ